MNYGVGRKLWGNEPGESAVIALTLRDNHTAHLVDGSVCNVYIALLVVINRPSVAGAVL